jgi:hypothetical protein
MDAGQRRELRRMLEAVDERLLEGRLSAAEIAEFRDARETILKLLNAAELRADEDVDNP